MTAPRLATLAAALLAAGVVAWLPWRGRLDAALARGGFLARFVASLALLLLLLDPGVRATVRRPTPLVLLVKSVSMHAAGAVDSAARLAASLGEVLQFGELAAGMPGGTTRLGDPLAAAANAGRPVVVVTDGEVDDVASIPADLLAQTAVRTLPRQDGADLAITDVRMPLRVAAGDTLAVEVDLRATNGWQDSVTVEVRDGDRVLLQGRAGFARADGQSVVRLAAPLPAGVSGERWLVIDSRGVTDAEPDDNARWRRLTITPSPGIVVVAARPDWDARFLYGALAAVTEAPVRGFVQLRPNQWRRMDDLRPVSAADVESAARQADLLAVRGDTAAWRDVGRSRLLWPSGTTAGDWYLAPAGASPLAGAFVGVEGDLLPPVTGASVTTGEWVALAARLARRGSEVPVIAGREGSRGRTVVFGVEGLHRWAFRGGEAEQAWRAMVAATASWLLATPEHGGPSARPVDPVAQRGRPLRFRWQGEGAPAPVAMEFRGDSLARTDTLRFDAEGNATVALPVGHYRYGSDGATHGTVAVEPYSDELVPRAVTLAAREAEVTPVPARRSLRELLPLFALAVLGFVAEWMIRRRLGLR